MPSDIQVFVRLQDQCVFAGEELKCSITFKNVASFSEPQTPGPNVRRNSRTPSIGKLPPGSTQPGDGPLHSPKASRFNYPPSAMKNPIPSVVSPPAAPPQRPGHKHQRSVSIISIGSPTTSQPSEDPSGGQAYRPAGGHRRSSTIQVYTGHSRRPSQYREPSTGLHIPPQAGRRSPLSSTSTSTPVYESRRSTPDFQFPPSTQPEALTQPTVPRETSRAPSPRNNGRSAVPTRLRREPSNASRVTSERSSGEFYSLSNHSQDTLQSEQPSILSERPQVNAPSAMMRRHYRMDSLPPATRRPQPQPASLLMGYAHLVATFTVDGSLVDQSPFEEVKRKGFLGGQAGGGVVGVTQKKQRPTSGFLSGFSFNSLGDSLNSLVGADNMSSVREMNAVTNSRAIPLLSTPQSLLFVNLHLEPGEEKSFSFSCGLPRGLPSSYRGKAIKIAYNIQIGVQTAPTGTRDRDHKVRQISVPIRIFSGVDLEGEILGHDLMQPHVLLRDPARTASIDDAFAFSNGTPQVPSSHRSKIGSSEAFLTYIDTLLDRSRRRHSSAGSVLDAGMTATEDSTHPTLAAINRAILLSNRAGMNPDSSSSNRFNITRAGHPVAVITLSRALFRLGETITASVAFASPDSTSIRVATLHGTLETTEKVAQSLAIRSATSIARVTRRTYSTWTSNVLFSKRAVYSPTVPVGGTPTFITSGVELAWGIRFEFGVIRNNTAPTPDEEIPEGQGGDTGEEVKLYDSEQTGKTSSTSTETSLFEEVVKDERGVVSIAVERLECEAFEVVIPITVYGDIVAATGDDEDVRGIPI
ncbi:uncharacterized protein HMPREF1541_07601 [Cyphellophora europaea CBS 101466]|uniref:Rgp1-domain-containing protein n=1 Tax=Cyphellophora europaea (strain CBS 101466) TaxID=1220924 RepID=W2RQJ8_CYPE1|nr:uncharacterized protein HMPREF1541_07601 [Cyphellophora europaea CBS 101466]ETN37978.1 hypothetical protein HMPREF1541_07601 [Cyphellophora europaea CBS 101466]